jgi:hypothetical protein
MTFSFEAAEQADIAIDENSGWPALSTQEFRQHRRIPETFEETVIADSLNRSVLEVQQQITKFTTEGNKDVPFAMVFESGSAAPDFSTAQISVYRGAVYARSHSDLMGYFSAVDQKKSGDNKAQDEEQQNAILAQSNRSVRLLLGLGRIGVQSL